MAEIAGVWCLTLAAQVDRGPRDAVRADALEQRIRGVGHVTIDTLAAAGAGQMMSVLGEVRGLRFVTALASCIGLAFGLELIIPVCAMHLVTRQAAQLFFAAPALEAGRLPQAVPFAASDTNRTVG